MPVSACETGQFRFASSAAAANASPSNPGTAPRTVSMPLVIPSPRGHVTVADVASRSDGLPPLARPLERALAQPEAEAAAGSTDGLGLPFRSSARDHHA